MLDNHFALIAVSWREAYLVVPTDNKGGETERLEVVEILQFAADALLYQQREIH